MKQLQQSCLICITILIHVIPVYSLKDVEIVVPKYVRRGQNIKLTCLYDLEKEPLYAVRVEFKNSEFYRYLPKEVPPMLAFPKPGITVDVTLSNEHDVLLKNVSLEASGLYKCVVAAEFPFQTLSSSSDMIVVVIGDDVPRMQLDRAQYHPGDVVSAVCQSPASYPPANVTWYIDDIKVDDGRIKTDVRKDRNDPVAKSIVSSISFDLPGKVALGAVKIYCRATVFSLYDRVSNFTTIQPIPRRLTGTETLLRPGSSRASSKDFSSLLLTIVTIFATLLQNNRLLLLLVIFNFKFCSTFS